MSEPDDFFADLNAEIKAEVARANRASEAEKLRKASNNRFASREHREVSKAEYEKLKAQMEAEQWGTVAYYAMFSEQNCSNCGSTHYTFLQMMAEQQSVNRATTKRFYPVGKIEFPDLPKKTMIQPLETSICGDCAMDHGFHIEDEFRKMLQPKRGAFSMQEAKEVG